MDQVERICFQIITYSSEANNKFLEAIEYAKENSFEAARECINEASELLVEAHKQQALLLDIDSKSSESFLSLLLIHTQDQLMSTNIYMEISKTNIEIYERLYMFMSVKEHLE